VVLYDLEYLAVQPSYNLEIEIDFKETFSYLRHRIGVNLLVAAVDLDLMTQEMINDGKITVREVDFSGKGNANMPVAGEGGVLKIVRDLMAPTLFTTVPIPTPEFRALPDSASRALETGGGTKAFLSTGTESSKQPTVVGTDLKVTHTPTAAGQTPGAAVDLSAVVEPATGVTLDQVKVSWRVQGSGAFQDVVLQRGAQTGQQPGQVVQPGQQPGQVVQPGQQPGQVVQPGQQPGQVVQPGQQSGQVVQPGQQPGQVVQPGQVAPPPADGTVPANAHTGRIPGQPSGTTVEYFIRATGTKAGAAITQNLPEKGETGPLTFSVGASTSQGGTKLKVPETDGPLIGYSLRSMDVTQQIKRKFILNRAEAVKRHHYPNGALSANGIGPEFNPAKQITRVALGQGPFKIIVIKVQAGFDFDKSHVIVATVHIHYGKGTGGPLHALTIPLTKEQPRGQTQFFADDRGTQDYSYWVEFTYDPDRVVGTTPGTALKSQVFTGVTSRSITVDLDLHSPLIPVKVEAGVLSFDNGLVKQVQVRVAPSPTTEGRVIQLAKDRPGDLVLIVPVNPAARTYHIQEKFFFHDGSTTIDKPNRVDTNVVVNEPNDLVFKMIPQYADGSNLVKEVLVDASYTHGDGQQERSTLHLTSQNPRQEFAVLLRPNDPREWDAAFRFIMQQGDPLESPPQHVRISEPLVGLTKAGFKVVTVTLLDDTLFASTPDLLGLKVTLGQNVNDPALPTASVLLRASKTSSSLVVPGVLPSAPVSVAVEVLRRNQQPARSTSTLSASERELYVTS